MASYGSNICSSLLFSYLHVGSQITLLSAEERAKRTKLMSSHFAKSNADTSTHGKPISQEEQPRRSSRGRSKSPHRSTLPKSPGKLTTTAKSAPTPKKNHFTINGTPANHISTLLLREIMCDTRPVVDLSSDERPFLSTLDYLNTLSDLVLAVPACGAAIHRYKPQGSNKFHHAIAGCLDPPQTAVSFILHKILPQPRESSVNDSDEQLKLKAYTKTKLSQAGARLIVCLVARSGEGRRRVIADLVFALSSCGQHSVENSSQEKETSDDQAATEMWAISAWGDLCLGLSSPRSSNASLTGQQESNSHLSFGVVKLMLEAGAAHALMAAIERINLHNPMASSVATSIIRPLEVSAQVFAHIIQYLSIFIMFVLTLFMYHQSHPRSLQEAVSTLLLVKWRRKRKPRWIRANWEKIHGVLHLGPQIVPMLRCMMQL